MEERNIEMTDSRSFPYSRFSDIRIKSSEPMSYAYFNSHVMRLCSNLDSLGESFTLQKATYTQWGTVKFATVDDIISESGNKDSVMTNRILNAAMEELRIRNMRDFMTKGKLNFTKNYEFLNGEFIVGVNEKIAKRITDSPDRVVYANVSFVLLGFDAVPFRTARVDSAPLSSYENGVKSSGIINFVDWKKPDTYREFHVYYHKNGYVICDNGKYDDSQKQIKVVWTLFMRKDAD